jgi:hypothetical protein
MPKIVEGGAEKCGFDKFCNGGFDGLSHRIAMPKIVEGGAEKCGFDKFCNGGFDGLSHRIAMPGLVEGGAEKCGFEKFCNGGFDGLSYREGTGSVMVASTSSATEREQVQPPRDKLGRNEVVELVETTDANPVTEERCQDLLKAER